MIQKFRNLLFTFLIFSLVPIGGIAQNITPDMIEKAKAAGVSQQQIDAALKQQQQNQNGSAPSVKPKVIPSNVDRNTRADSIYATQTKEMGKSVSDSVKKLMVFGREIFNQKNLTFAPNFNLSTPKSYRLGPGDELMINVYGASEENITQKISADGKVVIPSLGPISLSGLTIEGAESKLKTAMSKIYAGLKSGSTHLVLSLRNIRSIKVNIVGEVVAPGTYTLPSLATLFNALYVAGGINDIGSLRNVKVFRGSKLVGDLDVYDYLLNGKYESNVRLEDNDMIVVSPYQSLVTLSGAVKRSRIFEVKKEETLNDALRFAGGFKADAYSENVLVKRSNGRQYEIYTVEKVEYPTFKLQDGDSIGVGEVVKTYSNRLEIRGAVYRAGIYAFNEKISTVKQLIDKAEGVRGDAFLTRAQITRVLPDSSKQMIAVDLYALFNNKISDIPLQNKDVLYVPSIYDLQRDFTVTINGAVTNPDTYEYRKDMTVEDLIVISGGLKYDASLKRIEIARRIRDPYSLKPSEKSAEIFEFDINPDLTIAENAKSFALQPFDVVAVRTSPGYEKQQKVTIKGEVVFGGDFVFSSKNQRISEVIKGAGGVTPQAYIKGSRLTRRMTFDDSLRVINMLKVASSTSKDSVDIKKLDFGSEYYVGINLEEALKHPGSEADIVLKDGDVITVPQFNNTVKISGAVLYPNTVSYGKRYTLKDYISMAGGYGDGAKKRKAFVIYMNGMAARKRWFSSPRIEPGCEIIIPNKPNRRATSAGEILGYTSSVASIAAMMATFWNVMK